jgi:hypothetical protein
VEDAEANVEGVEKMRGVEADDGSGHASSSTAGVRALRWKTSRRTAAVATHHPLLPLLALL